MSRSSRLASSASSLAGAASILSVCQLTYAKVIICPIAIPQHGTDYQISLFVGVCMYVCVCGHAYGRIFQPIFSKFGKDLWGLNRKNRLGWGRNPKMLSAILTPQNPQNLPPR